MCAVFVNKFAKCHRQIGQLAAKRKLRVEFVVEIDRATDEGAHEVVGLPEELVKILASMNAGILIDCLW